MQECTSPARRHRTTSTWQTPGAVRLADTALALSLILLLLPMLLFVAAFGQRALAEDGTSAALRRFRGDQLHQLFGVLRGDLSFFRASRRPLAFAD